MSRSWRIPAILLAGLVSAAVLTANWSASQEKPPPAKQPASTAADKAPADKPLAEKAPLAAPPEADAAEQTILKKLEEPTDFDFDKTLVHKALEQISQKHKLQMVLDSKHFAEAKVTPFTHVTRSLKGLTVRQGLKHLLADLGLAAVVRGDVLVITSMDADEPIVAKTYAVGDLARLRLKTRDEEGDYDALREVLTSVIDADAWTDTGGPGTCELFRSVMVVGQSPQRHERIARFLARLRQAHKQVAEGKGEARLAVIDANDDADGNAKTRAKLRRTVSVDWNETMLGSCVRELQRDHGLRIEMDAKNLGDANVTIDTPVTLKLSGVSLQAVLDHLTEPLGAAWILRDGVVLITSKEQQDTYLTPRIYPVPDLLPHDSTSGDPLLEDVIKNSLRPDSWTDTGGPGNVLRCDGIGCLVCMQTQPVHEEIERFLTALRRDIATSPAAPRSTGEMTLRVYRLGDPLLAHPSGANDPFGGGGQRPVAGKVADEPKAPAKTDGPSAEAIAKVIRDLVAPESWDAPGSKAYLRPLGDRIIVRQTPKVQREVRELLEKLGVVQLPGAFGGGGFF